MHIRLFNLAAFSASCLILLIVLACRVNSASHCDDIAQFYMGGLMARTANWKDLYPVPYSNSLENPGPPSESAMKPEYARLASGKGVGDKYRFIQSPPTALLLAPLSLAPFGMAAKLWIATMVGCGIIVVWQTGRIAEQVWSRPTCFRGISMLAVSCCPGMWESMTGGNISSFMGLCIGTSVLGLICPKDARAGIAIAFGAIVKYVTAPLIVVPLFTMRKKVLVWTALTVVALLGLTFAIGGIEPFRAFASLAPFLARPWLTRASPNHTIYIIAWKLRGRVPLSKASLATIECLRWSLFALLLYLGFHLRQELLTRKQLVVAMCACLITWFMMFSPIVWGTYLIYLAPFAGWIIWEAVSSWRVAAFLAVPILLIWMPASLLPLSPWREPLQSGLFWGMLAIFCLGFLRLVRATGNVGIRSAIQGRLAAQVLN